MRHVANRPWLGFLAGLFALVFSVTVSSAQETAVPDYVAWTEMSQRVERVLTADRAKDETLEQLRESVAIWRDTFLNAESLNESRIERINRQIESLGPAPTEGQSEAEEVAARRSELKATLSALQVPIVRASEAYIEADGLIREIDVSLRDRQAEQVLTRLRSPINLFAWSELLLEARELFGALPREVATSLGTPNRRRELLSNLPGSSVLAVVGLFLLIRSSHWTDRLATQLQNLTPRVLRRILHGVLNLLQLALPYAGLVACLAAIQNFGLFGATGENVLFSLSLFGLVVVVGAWLVKRLFPRTSDFGNPLTLDEDEMRRGRMLSQFLVLTLGLYVAVAWLSEKLGFSELSRALLVYVVCVALAYVLFRLMRLFRTSNEVDPSLEADARNFTSSIVHALAGLTMLICVAGIFVGFLGYYALAEKLIVPAVLTFVLSAFLALVHDSGTEFYTLFSRHSKPREDSLIPIIFAAFLILLSLPLVSLIWGARVTDLTEFWSKIREGFSIGEIRISPSETIAFIVVFALMFGLTRLVQTALRTTILPKTQLDQGARTALVSGVGYIGIFLAALIAVTTAGIDMSAFAIFASALAVGVGFGLQTIVSNFVSGIILLVERPVSEGDWIEVNGQMGYVRRISVRATRIETFDRTDVIVPNADLVSGSVTNWTRGNLIGRVIVPVGVAYGSDTRKVERLLLEIAEAHPMVVLQPPPGIVFVGFGESSLDFEIRAILRDINFMLSAKSDMNHEIARIFESEGIEIPFAQRDLWLRNPEVLIPQSKQSAPPEVPKEPAPVRETPVSMTIDDMDNYAGDSDGDGDNT